MVLVVAGGLRKTSASPALHQHSMQAAAQPAPNSNDNNLLAAFFFPATVTSLAAAAGGGGGGADDTIDLQEPLLQAYVAPPLPSPALPPRSRATSPLDGVEFTDHSSSNNSGFMQAGSSGRAQQMPRVRQLAASLPQLAQRNSCRGILLAAAGGVCWGSAFVPLYFVQGSGCSQGIAFLPPVACGVLLVAVSACLALLQQPGGRSSSSLGRSSGCSYVLLLPAAAGGMWAGSLVCCLSAVPVVGITVTALLSQPSAAAAGLLATCMLREVIGLKATVLSWLGVVLLVGSQLLVCRAVVTAW